MTNISIKIRKFKRRIHNTPFHMTWLIAVSLALVRYYAEHCPLNTLVVGATRHRTDCHVVEISADGHCCGNMFEPITSSQWVVPVF